MNQVSNKSVVRRFFDVYNTKDYARLSQCMAPGYLDHNLPQVRSLDDAVEILKSTHSAFPDLQVVIDELIEDNDLIAFRGRFCGTHMGSFGAHAATGRRIEFSALEIFRIREQKIVESWGYWPTDEIIRQLTC